MNSCVCLGTHGSCSKRWPRGNCLPQQRSDWHCTSTLLVGPLQSYAAGAKTRTSNHQPMHIAAPGLRLQKLIVLIGGSITGARQHFAEVKNSISDPLNIADPPNQLLHVEKTASSSSGLMTPPALKSLRSLVLVQISPQISPAVSPLTQ